MTAVPDPRFRDQLAEDAYMPLRRAFCERGIAAPDIAALDSDASYVAGRLADALLPLIAAELARVQAAEQRGYERGRRDFQFAPEGDNHHNAALCPYCSPRVQAAAEIDWEVEAEKRLDALIAVRAERDALQAAANQRAAENTADAVLALADDMLAKWPGAYENPDLDDIYDWLVAQSAEIRTLP